MQNISHLLNGESQDSPRIQSKERSQIIQWFNPVGSTIEKESIYIWIQSNPCIPLSTNVTLVRPEDWGGVASNFHICLVINFHQLFFIRSNLSLRDKIKAFVMHITQHLYTFLRKNKYNKSSSSELLSLLASNESSAWFERSADDANISELMRWIAIS